MSPPLSRHFRSAVVALRSALVVVALLTACAWLADAFIYERRNEFLTTAIVGVFGLGFVAILGTVTAATTPWRRSRPAVERAVIGIQAVALCFAAALWVGVVTASP